MVSRRALLGAGGAVLALPWLEALAPRPARGQSDQGPLRFLPVFFGCGAPDYWWPSAPGQGSGWQLSSLLEPFAPFKDRVLLLGNVENYSPFNANGSSSVEPSHGRQSGAFLTCADAGRKREQLGVDEANGISVDQVLAKALAGQTRVDSLQLGLSTINSYCDGQPCSGSRSISWAEETTPLYKQIDPPQVFDRLFGAGQPLESKRNRHSRSVIDAVLASSKALEGKLGQSDRQTLDRYLTSLREVEKKVDATCVTAPTRPTFSARVPMKNGDEGYDRGVHWDVMNDLMALAFQCDLTRVISFMIDDERSEFVYDHLETRHFTPTTSTPGDGSRVAYELHGGGQSGADNNETWCTVTRWQSVKLVELCQKLASMPEGEGSVLDGLVMFYGASMHGADHSAEELPSLLLASNKLLRSDRYLRFDQPCSKRDVFYTLLNGVFGLDVPSFGESALGLPNRLVTELLA